MGEGRRFEHTHNIRPALREQHAATPLELAHPDMAGVARAPEPGSPADYRRAAAELREQAAHFRAQADRCEHEAAKLEAQAARDELEPPSEAERIRRLLEGGLS
jgi:hypothetical protein